MNRMAFLISGFSSLSAASMSSQLQILVGKLKASDVDGFSVVLSDAVSNKFSTLSEFTVALKNKCPGMLELFLMFWTMVKVFINECDAATLDALKQVRKEKRRRAKE